MKLGVVGLLSVVLAPAVCPADFPLPSSLEVGDSWTYSIRWTTSSLDTALTQTLTIRVVERLQIEGQTYFKLNNGVIYRVDEEGRTWWYNTIHGPEKIGWDIWGEEVEVCRGISCWGYIKRYGPYVRKFIQVPEYGVEGWFFMRTGADGELHGLSMVSPYALTYDALLRFSDLGVTELYVFQPDPKGEPRLGHVLFVISPNIGVVYYSLSSYFNDAFSPDIRSFSAGKIATSHIHPGPSARLQTTEWILQDFQQGAPASTAVEDISFGQLKQRIARPVANPP